ncbi:uncharacterized protein LOC143222221 [Tachypleus tridentatus]|uniref:uncharacterized protein LOC143222221 n=1 Tax=Tachypleus tridentatus TaxID=6853 RepID=UPI003FD2F2A2
MPLRIQPWKDDIIQFCQNLLQSHQPRDDYKELLELAVIFLGSLPHRRSSVSFRTSGAVHRARWMARAIYSLKIWMFQEKFGRLQPRPASSRVSFHAHFCSKLGDLCVFITKHYLLSWFTAKDASVAARRDFTLLKELALHENHMIKEVSTKAMNRHLWYLSEVGVGLALFDDGVTNSDKLKMVSYMNTVKGSPRPTPRLTVDAASNAVSRKLPDCFTSATNKIFYHLDISSAFLSLPPKEWSASKEYKQGKDRVKKLFVTNDAAERGVTLIQQFTAKGRTKSEDQFQYMIQVAEEHRRT